MDDGDAGLSRAVDVDGTGVDGAVDVGVVPPDGVFGVDGVSFDDVPLPPLRP